MDARLRPSDQMLARSRATSMWRHGNTLKNWERAANNWRRMTFCHEKEEGAPVRAAEFDLSRLHRCPFNSSAHLRTGCACHLIIHIMFKSQLSILKRGERNVEHAR